MDVHNNNTVLPPQNQNGKVESEIQSDQNTESEMKQQHAKSNSTFNPMLLGIIAIYTFTL